MDFNYTPSESYDLPSWQESFSAPSVAPSISSSYNFTSPGAYDYASSYQSQPTSSNWTDYLKAGGLALSATGDAIRAFRGEPISPGSSPFQQYLAEERQKEDDKRLADMLKDALGSSSTDPIEEVLDPAAERRRQPRLFGQLPSLAGTAGSTYRLAGSLFD
jgi:hypothetical protein